MANKFDAAELVTQYLADLAFGSPENANFSKRQAWRGNSIKTKTKNLIMQFPLLISENISIDTASTLAEGFERENAILVRLLLQNDLGSLTNNLDKTDRSVANMLNTIHTNIDSNLLHESKLMIEENLRQLIPIEDKFNKFSINEGTLPKYLRESSYDVTSSKRVIVPGEKGEDDQEEIMTSNSYNNTRIDVNNNPFDPKLFDKINKLAPTFISMKLHVSEGGSERGTITGEMRKDTIRDVDIFFGVKCVVHALKSDDIIHNISIGFKNSTLFKLVKWTTGEYGFFKGIGEILFDYSRMRELGIRASKQSNYWWFKLKKLKNANRARMVTFSKKIAPTKTATLIISKDEVDTLERIYRIDVKQCKMAYKIINELFLLNFGYVDETTETVYLYDEVSNSYIVKKLDDFKSKTKEKAISVEDIKSLFGR